MENKGELTYMLPGLYALSSKGVKLGLDRTIEGLKRLGNPEKNFPVVLVTGTNGKGSVAASLEAVLNASGYKTGMFTSPHLIRYNERVRISGKEISDRSVEAILKEIGKKIYFDFKTGGVTDKARHLPLTFFEVTTGLALTAFKQAEVDIAILEIGLGGRLDSTNATDPVFTIITPIGYDHTTILGDSLAEIASEKAMTMRKDRSALIACMPEEARETLYEKAKAIGSHIVEVADHFQPDGDNKKFTVQYEDMTIDGLQSELAGEYQRRNAAQGAIAAMVMKKELGFDKITPLSIKAGIKNTRWRGRAEWLDGNPPWLVDCSHNREGMTEFLKTLREFKQRRSIKKAGLIFASTRAGFLAHILEMLAPEFEDIICTQSSSNRTILATDIHAVAKRYFKRSAIAGGVQGALEILNERNPALDLIVFTGSLYLAGNALALREDPEALENPFPNA